MKIIIAGSKSINPSLNEISEIVQETSWTISEIVSGGANGVDCCGELWAKKNNVPCKTFKANWNDLTHADAIIKTSKHGKYDANAGYRRNIEMSKYADGLIAIWDSKSNGTKHMIDVMNKFNKPVFVHIYGKQKYRENFKLR